MDLNLISIGYLCFFLAPFILVCFFTLNSIFNQDFKGLVYLIGLIVSCFITILIDKSGINNYLPAFESTSADIPGVCNSISIAGVTSISNLPLNQTIFGYTFAYLLYAILAPNPNLVLQNLPTIIFFPILIVIDIYWKLSNGCSEFWHMVAALIIGGLAGWTWGAIIGSSNTNLQYFAVAVHNTEICSAPSKQTFRCNVYKNGKMISSNMTQ